MTLNVAVGLRESTRRTPEKVALIQNDASFTYAQVHAAAQRFAGGLRNLGVKPGEHVALLLP
ncbi:MAG TPA: AMP-binding protein, partial [Polyangiaceae bacterium]